MARLQYLDATAGCWLDFPGVRGGVDLMWVRQPPGVAAAPLLASSSSITGCTLDWDFADSAESNSDPGEP